MRASPAYLLCAFLWAACGQGPQQQATDTTAAALDTAAREQAAIAPLPEPIIAERANGDAVLMDTINGKAILSLKDNTLLNSGPLSGNWAMAGIETDLDKTEYESGILKKGRPLRQDGRETGAVLEDIRLADVTADDQGRYRGVIYAYLPQSGIKPGSVIEEALSAWLQQHGRKKADWQPFIKQFKLDAWDGLAPYQQFTNYESTVEDPSPAFRTVLIFHQDQLMGVADSRPLQLPGATAHALNRDYTVYFFPDVAAKQQQDYIKQFNRFINSVD